MLLLLTLGHASHVTRRYRTVSDMVCNNTPLPHIHVSLRTLPLVRTVALAAAWSVIRPTQVFKTFFITPMCHYLEYILFEIAFHANLNAFLAFMLIYIGCKSRKGKTKTLLDLSFTSGMSYV